MNKAVRRSAGRAVGRSLVLVLTLTACPPDRLSAQRPDTTRAHVAAAPAVPDTTKFIKPGAAAWRSLVLPGWGQAASGHHVAGALFATWEGVTIMMTLRAKQEERYLEAAAPDAVPAKRQQVQDWLVLWIFNHLFAGADAFVAAHLQDFPKELKIEAGPAKVTVRVALPR